MLVVIAHFLLVTDRDVVHENEHFQLMLQPVDLKIRYSNRLVHTRDHIRFNAHVSSGNASAGL